MEDWRVRRRGQIAYYKHVSHSSVFFYYITITSTYVFPWMHVLTPGLLQYTAINIDLAICMDHHTLSLLYILLVLLGVLSD